MFAKHPEIAERWTLEEKTKKRLKKVYGPKDRKTKS